MSNILSFNILFICLTDPFIHIYTYFYTRLLKFSVWLEGRGEDSTTFVLFIYFNGNFIVFIGTITIFVATIRHYLFMLANIFL